MMTCLGVVVGGGAITGLRKYQAEWRNITSGIINTESKYASDDWNYPVMVTPHEIRDVMRYKTVYGIGQFIMVYNER